jgi:hypothetical protein
MHYRITAFTPKSSALDSIGVHPPLSAVKKDVKPVELQMDAEKAQT